MTRQLGNPRLLLAGASALVLSLHQARAADADPAPPQTPVVTDLGRVGTTDEGQATAAPSATGDRAQAKEKKKEAPNIIEVQPYQEIMKLPDVNVAEALQRVPGISLESDSGEGRFINIRGLDADLNGTTFDDVRLTPSNQSSPLGGGRAVAFDAFPAGAIGGVEVIKTLTPDIDAEGLGGVVNLLPRSMPADGHAFLEANFAAGFENLRPTAVFKGDITAGVSFGLTGDTAPWILEGSNPGPFSNDRPFSIIATFSRYDDSRGIDDVEEDYSDMPGIPNKALADQQMRWYEYHRARQGGGGALSFQPDDQDTFYIRAFDSGYEEQATKHYLRFNGLDGSNGAAPAVTVLPNGSFVANDVSAEQDATNTDELIENKLFEAAGHTVIADVLKLDFRAAWTDGSDSMPSGYSSSFAGPSGFTLNYNNQNPAAETYTPPAGINLQNPALYTLSQIQNSPFQDSDREWSGAIDATFPLSLGGYDGRVKFGGSARLRTRSDNQDQMTFAPVGTQSLASYVSGGDQIYYNGLYNIGPQINARALTQAPVVLSDPVGDYISNQEAFQHDTENVYAGYGMYTIDIEQLELLGGVRVEATDAKYKANVGTTDPTGTITTITPTSASTNYTNVFPSFQAKYAILPDLIARAAFSTAIARPGFNQITAAKTIDFSQFTVSQGNPSLKPTTGLNYDATLEYYMPNGGIASFGAFDKEFDNYIVPTSFFADNFEGTGNIFMIGNFKNISGAEAQGLEVSYTQQFTFLPAPFDGFGFDGNYTYNHSRGQIRPGEYEPLPSTSPQNFNAAIFYEKDPITFRVAASYVSKDLFSVGGDRDTDIFSRPRFRLDLAASYAVTDQVSVSFDAKNLTNTPLEFTESQVASRPIQREFYDQTYLFGIRLRLDAVRPAPETAAPPPPLAQPAPAPVAAPEAAREFQVFFDFDRSNITDAAARVIEAAAAAVKAGNIVHITVTGHTDTVGTARYNQALSERRAIAVKSALVADGVAGGEVMTLGVGKNGLLVPTRDGVREPQNRRAVIELQ